MTVHQILLSNVSASLSLPNNFHSLLKPYWLVLILMFSSILSSTSDPCVAILCLYLISGGSHILCLIEFFGYLRHKPQVAVVFGKDLYQKKEENNCKVQKWLISSYQIIIFFSFLPPLVICLVLIEKHTKQNRGQYIVAVRSNSCCSNIELKPEYIKQMKQILCKNYHLKHYKHFQIHSSHCCCLRYLWICRLMKNIYALLYAFVMFIQFGYNERFLPAQNLVLFLTVIFNYFELFDGIFHVVL